MVPRRPAAPGYLSIAKVNARCPLAARFSVSVAICIPASSRTTTGMFTGWVETELIGDTGGSAGGVIEGQEVARGIAALEWNHCLLAIGIVAEDHEPSDVTVGGELSGASSGRGIRRAGRRFGRSAWLPELKSDSRTMRLEFTPVCGKESGKRSWLPSSAKKVSAACAGAEPVLTRTKVVCQPLPVARCAMDPTPVPTLANAGMVVSVLLVPNGVVRMPSTLIWRSAGVSNSMVPRMLAVTGY